MAWSVKEQEAKIKRIHKLTSLGFNTPRMIFLPFLAPDNQFSEVSKWATKINEIDNEQIFNIRTYKRTGQKESVQTTHKTDVLFGDLNYELLRLNAEFNCMIDAETPDDGRYAGNIIIEEPTMRKQSVCTIEYCQKDIRAMVRDHDKSIVFRGPLALEQPVLQEVFEKVSKSGILDVILEWTWFVGPAGILGENLVWWESRKY